LLLYRWNSKGGFIHHLDLRLIDPAKRYKVCDVDEKTEIEMSGEYLLNNGLDVLFSANRLSALVFIEPIEPVETAARSQQSVAGNQ
jgi:hypothetical protein